MNKAATITREQFEQEIIAMRPFFHNGRECVENANGEIIAVSAIEKMLRIAGVLVD